MNNHPNKIAAYADQFLPLTSAYLSDEYYYQSLSLCIIDAVFSIGVRYEGVRNTVMRYCEKSGLQRIRTDKKIIPARKEQESVTAFFDKIERIGFFHMAESIYHNRQRTSPRNGILKAEAVQLFASVLQKHGIEHLQDIPKAHNNTILAAEIQSIPGQKSGISLKYFLMLSGADDFIKPDRMILAFIKNATGKSINLSEAQDILSKSTDRLKTKYPNLSPRLLDHEIWKYQRENMG